MSRLSLVVGGLAVVAVIVAGSLWRQAPGNTRSAGTGPVLPRGTNIPRGTDIRLPLDDYLLTAREQERVHRAYLTLRAKCLRQFGFAVPVPSTTPSAGLPTLNERRYGVTDPARAAVLGYHVSSHEPSTSPAARDDERDPEFAAALRGGGPPTVRGVRVPEGGCFAEARRQVSGAGPTVADSLLAQRLSMDSFAATRRDERVQAASLSWSWCMRDRGYTYAGPLDPPGDQRFRGDVSATEIATAKADVACKDQTGLVRVWSEVESAWQRPQVEANRAALEQIRRANQAQLQIARGLGFG
jgi:hypothetical protein